MISKLSTRLSKADSESDKKFWEIAARKYAGNQPVDEVSDIEKNQEHSKQTQEHKSGTDQDCQEEQKPTRYKHMLGLRQFKTGDSSKIHGRGRRRIPSIPSRDPISKSNISVYPSGAAKSAAITRDIRKYFGKVDVGQDKITHLRGKVEPGPGGDINKTRKTGTRNQDN